jgi:ribosomal protein S18 acetylase RimI-like enzyme
VNDALINVVKIRSFRPSDAEVCKRLYLEGRISGTNSENDTGLDIDDIQSAYMNVPGAHFWVAESDTGEVVGMIGVQQHSTGEGEIRRLRVRPDQKGKGIGSMLLEIAITHCREAQHLKVTLDTFMDPEPAFKMFGSLKFKHSRTRVLGAKSLHYFYLDLYSKS